MLSKKNGDLDLGYIEIVCCEIGFVICEKFECYIVVVCSIVLLGIVNNVVILLIEDCLGKKVGVDFGVGINFEFFCESIVIKDYDFLLMIVIGELDKQIGDFFEEIYCELDVLIICKIVEVVEMIKYICNVWYVVKVIFVNEIGNIVKVVGVDGCEVMDVICQDYKFNLLCYYMCFGFVFGGFCLFKDVCVFIYCVSQLDVEYLMFGLLMCSNFNQVQKVFDFIISYDICKVGLFGLLFKVGIDDLCESLLVELVEMFIGKGYELCIFDCNVEYVCVYGVNKEYIELKILYVFLLLVFDFDEVVVSFDVLVLGNGDELFVDLVNKILSGKKLVDLVGFMLYIIIVQVEGICWQWVVFGFVSW